MGARSEGAWPYWDGQVGTEDVTKTRLKTLQATGLRLDHVVREDLLVLWRVTETHQTHINGAWGVDDTHELWVIMQHRSAFCGSCSCMLCEECCAGQQLGE